MVDGAFQQKRTQSPCERRAILPADAGEEVKDREYLSVLLQLQNPKTLKMHGKVMWQAAVSGQSQSLLAAKTFIPIMAGIQIIPLVPPGQLKTLCLIAAP